MPRKKAVTKTRARKQPGKRTVKRRTASPAQLRALAKGRRTIAANRKANLSPVKKSAVKRNPKSRGPYILASQSTQGKKTYYDGASMTFQKGNAANFFSFNHSNKLAIKLADKLRKPVMIIANTQLC